MGLCLCTPKGWVHIEDNDIVNFRTKHLNPLFHTCPMKKIIRNIGWVREHSSASYEMIQEMYQDKMGYFKDTQTNQDDDDYNWFYYVTCSVPIDKIPDHASFVYAQPETFTALSQTLKRDRQVFQTDVRERQSQQEKNDNRQKESLVRKWTFPVFDIESNTS